MSLRVRGWTLEQWRVNRAANLRMLVGRYIKAGRADHAYDCAVRLVRVSTGRSEEGTGAWSFLDLAVSR